MPKFICIGSLLLLSLSILVLDFLGYGFTYQDSASMKEGWYWFRPIHQPLYRGEVVLFRPGQKLYAYMRAHHWIAKKSVMMKHVFALPGDFVCRKGRVLLINHQVVATIMRDYAPGKALPQLKICRTLGYNEYMLMSTRVKDSFDSRYFGPIARSQIFARVVDYE